MTYRVRSALTRGVTNLLLVGILAQGAVPLGLDIGTSFGVVTAVAVAPGIAVVFVTHVIESRLERKGGV